MPRNHSYFIAVTIPDPLNSEIESIKKNISEKYGTKSVLKSPPHITIVPPFFWGNEEGLIKSVIEFTFPEFKIELNGYNSFPLGVVYIDVVENNSLQELNTQFSNYFADTCFQLNKRHPFPFQPHITVGNRDWKKEQFNLCWNEMKDKKFLGSFSFTKLSLLKNVNGLWKDVLK